MIVTQRDVQILRLARKLLTPQGAWLRKEFTNTKKTRFCLRAACLEAMDRVGGPPTGEFIALIYLFLPAGSVLEVWNSRAKRTQTEVLGVLDRAIAKGEELAQ